MELLGAIFAFIGGVSVIALLVGAAGWTQGFIRRTNESANRHSNAIDYHSKLLDDVVSIGAFKRVESAIGRFTSGQFDKLVDRVADITSRNRDELALLNKVIADKATTAAVAFVVETESARIDAALSATNGDVAKHIIAIGILNKKLEEATSRLDGYGMRLTNLEPRAVERVR